jgi:hypothetical protein
MLENPLSSIGAADEVVEDWDIVKCEDRRKVIAAMSASAVCYQLSDEFHFLL